MKSILNQDHANKLPVYPCLQISERSGNVVLFTNWDTGTIVHVGSGSKGWKIGDHSDGLDQDSFKPFTGSVTLSND